MIMIMMVITMITIMVMVMVMVMMIIIWPSLRPSARNISAPTGRILVIFCTGDLNQNLSTIYEFG